MKKSGNSTRKRQLLAVCAAVILSAGCLPGMTVNAFAAENQYYTSVDELAGIEFDSFDDLAEFVKENSGKSVIKGIEKEVSDFLLSSDGIYIPAAYANKISEIDSILITPTYISTTFIIDNVRHSFYHYFSDKSGEIKLEEAKRYYKEKRYSCEKTSCNGNTIYYYELLEEWYYTWEQNGEYFQLRVGSSEFYENDAELCSALELSLKGENTEGGFKKTEDGTYYIKADGSYAKGWLDIDGKTYYFKSNGIMATNNYTIKGVRYKFSSDGVCQGKFTGWTKTAKGRRYYKNGVIYTNKWIKTKKGYYYAGKDGYMRTGWAKVTRGEGAYSYFDENGLWDGKAYYTGYQPKDLYSFMQDIDFLSADTYSYSTTDYNKGMKEFKDSEAFRKLLKEIVTQDLYTPLLLDRQLSDDEIEQNENIYHGGKAIKIKFLDKPGFEFTKDKEGNSYLYNVSYGFGLKLKDKDAYDKIAKLIS